MKTYYKKRYGPYSELHKVLGRFMKVVPDWLPKYNALLDSPGARSEDWLLGEMKKMIEDAEKKKAETE